MAWAIVLMLMAQAASGVYLKLHIPRLRSVVVRVHGWLGRLYPLVGQSRRVDVFAASDTNTFDRLDADPLRDPDLRRSLSGRGSDAVLRSSHLRTLVHPVRSIIDGASYPPFFSLLRNQC